MGGPAAGTGNCPSGWKKKMVIKVVFFSTDSWTDRKVFVFFKSKKKRKKKKERLHFDGTYSRPCLDQAGFGSHSTGRALHIGSCRLLEELGEDETLGLWAC